MSVAAPTSNTKSWALNVLADYEIKHTNPAPIDEIPLYSPCPLSSTNPDGWPTDQRRVPPYRPINLDLDRSERFVFTSTAERAFIMVMFLGVRMNSTANTMWRATGGRINNTFFRYDIGGEY